MLTAPAPHPVRGIMACRRITVRQMARDLGYSESYSHALIQGHWRLTREFVTAVSDYLGEPPSALFRPDELPEGVE